MHSPQSSSVGTAQHHAPSPEAGREQPPADDAHLNTTPLRTAGREEAGKTQAGNSADRGHTADGLYCSGDIHVHTNSHTLSTHIYIAPLCETLPKGCQPLCGHDRDDHHHLPLPLALPFPPPSSPSPPLGKARWRGVFCPYAKLLSSPCRAYLLLSRRTW